MTDRTPVSTLQNVWFDSQQVDNDDLTLEQQHNDQIQSGIVNNHFGSGVLPEVLGQKILFDTNDIAGNLDGIDLDSLDQPSDKNYGNQLEIDVSGTIAAGNRRIKLAIIGLDFENNLQYDTFFFSKNEKVITKKHYVRILKVFLNDFLGNSTISFNLKGRDGRIVIKEASSFSLSRDTIMVAQDVEPNLFWKDFFIINYPTITTFLEASLPSYNIDNLNISTGYKQLRSLQANDVSSQIGQKFLATTNNIQKVTLLLSVDNPINPYDLVWLGDLIVSIYPLQSSIECDTDIVPGLAIDFDPANVPLAQLSVNYTTLLNNGIVLNTVPQPVDFVFSNTPVANGSAITPGSHYVVTIKRSGSATSGVLSAVMGNDRTSDSRATVFNGSVWVDIPEEDMWFQVWTDSAKITDGQAYDKGIGIIVPKTQVNNSTAITEDYSLDGISFTRNDVYYALVKAATQSSAPVQDERTGNNVFSRKQYTPEVDLIKSSDLLELQEVSTPFVVGTISDKNVKTYNAASADITSKFHYFSMIGNECVIKVIEDPTDPRYDLTVLNLVTEFLNGNLLNAKIAPNINNPSVFYRIANAELQSMTFGDVNGDGVVDEQDLLIAQNLLDYSLNSAPNAADYTTLTTLFVNDSLLTFNVIDPVTLVPYASGTDGIMTVNSLDGTSVSFNSTSVNFSLIPNIGDKVVVVSLSSNPGNNGTFTITGISSPNQITLKKKYINSEILTQILRADITGGFNINSSDINYISDYVNKVNPFPSPIAPGNKIGTKFNVLKFVLEPFVDRHDDYPNTLTNRNSTIHVQPDIYENDAAFVSNNFISNPIEFRITKQLTWSDYAVVTTSNPRKVASTFTTDTGFNLNKCQTDGVSRDNYPLPLDFDPGRNDYYVSNNLILDAGGEIIRPDGYFYKVDFETNSLSFEIPAISFNSERTINLFTDFVADYDGNGKTRLGYRAMKFADCSTVKLDALQKNQVKFHVSVQSFSPQINGIDEDDLSGVITDGRIGVFMDHSTGLLTLNFENLYKDPVLKTLSTKLQIMFMLKRAGFNNTPLSIDSDKTKNLLGL